jgi:prepilin-type N-terminal cleavage/methylation domain-containing protein/prepilin-type processing-associated H-X9-DG protein
MTREAHGPKVAFTLVELLVVVAIIAVLAALLLPGLSNAKALGRLARCKGNVRQLGVAMGMYATDEGRYPFYLMVTALPTNFLSWDQALFPYTKNRWTDVLYKCPSYPYTTQPIRYDPNSQFCVAPQGSYGYNWIGTGELPPNAGASILHLGLGAMALPGAPVEGSRRESDVVVPAEMVALGDGGGGQISPPSGVPPDYHRFAHRTLLNMAFCDGHVETVDGYRFYEATNEARRRFNYDHQPHPETWDDYGKGNSEHHTGPPRKGGDNDGDHTGPGGN